MKSKIKIIASIIGIIVIFFGLFILTTRIFIPEVNYREGVRHFNAGEYLLAMDKLDNPCAYAYRDSRVYYINSQLNHARQLIDDGLLDDAERLLRTTYTAPNTDKIYEMRRVIQDLKSDNTEQYLSLNNTFHNLTRGSFNSFQNSDLQLRDIDKPAWMELLSQYTEINEDNSKEAVSLRQIIMLLDAMEHLNDEQYDDAHDAFSALDFFPWNDVFITYIDAMRAVQSHDYVTALDLLIALCQTYYEHNLNLKQALRMSTRVKQLYDDNCFIYPYFEDDMIADVLFKYYRQQTALGNDLESLDRHHANENVRIQNADGFKLMVLGDLYREHCRELITDMINEKGWGGHYAIGSETLPPVEITGNAFYISGDDLFGKRYIPIDLVADSLENARYIVIIRPYTTNSGWYFENTDRAVPRQNLDLYLRDLSNGTVWFSQTITSDYEPTGNNNRVPADFEFKIDNEIRSNAYTELAAVINDLILWMRLNNP